MFSRFGRKKFVNKDKLFVYGIFLSESNRKRYGMSNPHYATVSGYITVGLGVEGYIVAATKVGNENIILTGLLVDVDPSYWDRLDTLEGGYDRVKITTTLDDEAWMYVLPERG